MDSTGMPVACDDLKRHKLLLPIRRFWPGNDIYDGFCWLALFRF